MELVLYANDQSHAGLTVLQCFQMVLKVLYPRLIPNLLCGVLSVQVSLQNTCRSQLLSNKTGNGPLVSNASQFTTEFSPLVGETIFESKWCVFRYRDNDRIRIVVSIKHEDISQLC